MTLKPYSLGERIVSALKLKRMTINEIATAVYSTHEMVRLRLSQLEKAGLVRRAGFAERVSPFGVNPYLWTIA